MPLVVSGRTLRMCRAVLVSDRTLRTCRIASCVGSHLADVLGRCFCRIIIADVSDRTLLDVLMLAIENLFLA